jgi:hypothetical protein
MAADSEDHRLVLELKAVATFHQEVTVSHLRELEHLQDHHRSKAAKPTTLNQPIMLNTSNNLSSSTCTNMNQLATANHNHMPNLNLSLSSHIKHQPLSNRFTSQSQSNKSTNQPQSNKSTNQPQSNKSTNQPPPQFKKFTNRPQSNRSTAQNQHPFNRSINQHPFNKYISQPPPLCRSHKSLMAHPTTSHQHQSAPEVLRHKYNQLTTPTCLHMVETAKTLLTSIK